MSGLIELLNTPMKRHQLFRKSEDSSEGSQEFKKEDNNSSSTQDEENAVNPKHALTFQILNIIGFVAVVIINALSSAGVLGETNAQVSNRYPTKFTPSNYSFSVWGLIYFALAVFVIFQALPSQRKNPVLFKDIHILFFFSCVCNFVWSIIFTYDAIWASAVIITLLLITLLVIYTRLGVGTKKNVGLLEYWTIHFPFCIYAAWLSAATVVNISVALSGKSGWYGAPWSEEGWSVLMISVIGVITTFLLITRRDAAFGGVIGWALIAIGKQQDQLGFPYVPLAGYIVGGTMAGLSALIVIYKIVMQIRNWINNRNSNSNSNA